MIICPFCRREITDVTKGEFFCTYCGQRINTATLPQGNIIEDPEEKTEVVKTEPENSLIFDEHQALVLPPAAGPVVISAFSGAIIMGFVLKSFVDIFLGLGFIIFGIWGLIAALVFTFREDRRRTESKIAVILDQVLIDLKYGDYNSAREKIDKIGSSDHLFRNANIKWITVRNLLISSVNKLSEEDGSAPLSDYPVPFPQRELYPEKDVSVVTIISTIIMILGFASLAINEFIGLAMAVSGGIALMISRIADPKKTSDANEARLMILTDEILSEIKNKDYSSAKNKLNELDNIKHLSYEMKTKVWSVKNLFIMLIRKLEG